MAKADLKIIGDATQKKIDDWQKEFESQGDLIIIDVKNRSGVQRSAVFRPIDSHPKATQVLGNVIQKINAGEIVKAGQYLFNELKLAFDDEIQTNGTLKVAVCTALIGEVNPPTASVRGKESKA